MTDFAEKLSFSSYSLLTLSACARVIVVCLSVLFMYSLFPVMNGSKRQYFAKGVLMYIMICACRVCVQEGGVPLQ